MIKEVIVTTQNPNLSTHIAPMGLRETEKGWLIAPFKPSITLDNIFRARSAVVNCVDDVRVFAGALTGHQDWPLVSTVKIKAYRLQAALSHQELELVSHQDDPERPRCYFKQVYQATHAAFTGFNRAQSAVIEAAVLVSRLGILPLEEITTGLQRLQIAIDKTAGSKEREAWSWLIDKVAQSQQDIVHG